MTHGQIAKSVLIYLGIPFLGRHAHALRPAPESRARRGTSRASSRAISPITLVALLFTIFVMFSLKGDRIVAAAAGRAADRRAAVIYFVIMFFV